jgi:integrase
VKRRAYIAAAQEPFPTMFAIVATSGIRAGELLALKVEDLDFAGRRIFIRRLVNQRHVQTVQSRASQKPLPMPEALAVILEDYLKSWRSNSGRWLFPTSRGTTFSANNVVQRKLWPILDALKIPRCGLHAFRHTHSSLLLEVGAPQQVAQAQLRHSDLRITLGIYSHIIGDSQRNAVEKVAEILRLNTPNREKSGEWIQ